MISRKNEIWKTYEPANDLPVPDTCFSMKIVNQFAVNIVENAKDVFILEYNHPGTDKCIEISFSDCFVQSFKHTYISNLIGDYPFTPGKWVYTVEDSEYLKNIQKEYLFPKDEKESNWQHYVFCTDEEIIDVIANDNPIITIKSMDTSRDNSEWY